MSKPCLRLEINWERTIRRATLTALAEKITLREVIQTAEWTFRVMSTVLH